VLPLVIFATSMVSAVGGVMVGALWMRKRMTPTDPHQHVWGHWEEDGDPYQQKRECFGCGELQIRKARPL